MFPELVIQPLVKFKVLTTWSKSCQVNHKGEWVAIQEHRQSLERESSNVFVCCSYEGYNLLQYGNDMFEVLDEK